MKTTLGRSGDEKRTELKQKQRSGGESVDGEGRKKARLVQLYEAILKGDEANCKGKCR